MANRKQPAFTLLELVLALSLSLLVLAAVGMAINLHFKTLDIRRTNVEEAQLARAVLRHIADDLRTAVQYTPPDLSGLDSVAGNSATAAVNAAFGDNGDPTDGGQTGGGSGTGGSGGSTGGTGTPANPQTPTGGGSSAGGGSSSGGSTGGTGAGGTGVPGFGTGSSANSIPPGGNLTGAEPVPEAQPTSVVGLYGSPMELRFDISRLPRVDQYQALLDPDSGLGVSDIPSDIKTVTYFVCAEGSASVGDAPGTLAGLPQPTTTGRGRGLMRSELDRAVTAWAEMNGAADSTYGNAKMLAEEVTSIQFQYFDGTGWLPDWDSQAMGGLPKAVEILMTILPSRASGEDDFLASSELDEMLEEQVYRLVVHLPTAQPGQNLAETTGEATDATSEEVLP